MFTKVFPTWSSKFSLLRTTKTLFSNGQTESFPLGFVGGCVFSGKEFKSLTPALSYLDAAFLSASISDRIVNYKLFKRTRDVEFFYSTFEQRRFILAFQPITEYNIKQAKRRSTYFISEGMESMQHSIRRCVGTCVQALQRRGIREIFVDPCGNPEVAAEGAYLGAFVYDELKSSAGQMLKPNITCYTEHLDAVSPNSIVEKEDITNAWNRGMQLAMAQNLARKWMEMPANILSPKVFATQVADILEDVPGVQLSVNIRDAEWCHKHKLNGLIAVGSGSHQNFTFLEIVYEGNPEHPRDHVALVGKGVTFDAGGICIKPAAGMEDMRADMGGAAVVAATVFGLANLRVPINVRAYIPLCENMPGGGAMRPGDVIKMANGLSVQVDNTDAEGRLILADALYMAHKHPDLISAPKLIIDVATLTGAISVALSDQFTGVFLNTIARQLPLCELWRRGEDAARPEAVAEDETEAVVDAVETDDAVDDVEVVAAADLFTVDNKIEVLKPRGYSLLECLRASAALRGDRVWNLPLLHLAALREQAHLADLVNVAGGSYARKGGSGIAASFLNTFVPGSIPWMHLDIAGVMKPDSRDGYMRKGMAGRPTRSLIEFLHRLSQIY